MPYKISRVVHFRDDGPRHRRHEFAYGSPIQFPYLPGNYDALVTEDAKLVSANSFEVPLFNPKGHGVVTENAGENSMVYIEIDSDKALKTLIAEPDDLSIDLLFGKKSLIYSFYNESGKKSTRIRMTIADDEYGIYSKIKSYPDELEYRYFFIQKAMERANPKPGKFDREILTAPQVADLLQVAPGTIANWTSEGRIPVVYAGSSPRYRRGDLENWLEEKE